MKKTLVIIGALLLTVISTQCLGAQPRGAETNGAAFDPVYSNPVPGQMPVMAWNSFPPFRSSLGWFETLRDCGVNISMGETGDTTAIRQALEFAEKAGIKVMLRASQTTHLSQIPDFVRRFRGFKALAGYSIGDEPDASRFSELRELRNSIYTMDTTHLVYLNLLPIVPNSQLKAASYYDYVYDCARQLELPMLSYDMYPIYVKDGVLRVRGDFYQNLEDVRRASLATGRPFWAFGLCMVHAIYPEPTPAHLRFELFNALAYGAQGVQYYAWRSYSPTSPTRSKCAVEPDGTPTDIYYHMQAVNREIQSLTDVFLGCRVEEVTHTGDVPQGCARMVSAPYPFRSIRSGRSGVVVSRITNNGRHYVVLVNHDVQRPQSVRLNWRGSLMRVYSNDSIVPQTGRRITLEPAGYAIFTTTR